MRVSLLRDADAWRQLCDPQFQQLWKRLILQCPWATTTQTVEFVKTWYEVYHSRFSPLLVCGYSSAGELAGFFPLALSSDGRELHPAGAHQGEYQGWLAHPSDSTEFIEQAVKVLADCVSQGRLTIRCLPPSTPIDWVERAPFWKRNCWLRIQRRPLMSLADTSRVAESLRKKSNKSRLNRLKKLGELEFELIHNHLDIAEEELQSIISSYDLRIGALAGILPFHDDPLKRQFYLELFKVPDLLHLTVLRVGKAFVSAHIGPSDGQNVVMGISAYSPFFAKLSPGKLHIFKLAEMLAEQGYSNLDLTPAGLYKDRFATHYDHVYGLEIFFRRAAFLKFQAARLVRRSTSGIIKSLGMSTENVRARIATFRRLRPKGMLKNVVSLIFKQAGARVYVFKPDEVKKLELSPLIAKDRLEDLLAFVATEPGQTRQGFFADALGRIEAGEHCYTRVEQGQLVHCGWRVDSLEEFIVPELNQRLGLEPNSAVLHGFWTHPEFRSRGFFQVALLQAISDAAAQAGNRYICAVVPRHSTEACRIVEKCGGVYNRTLSVKKFFGITWRQLAIAEPAELSTGPRGSTFSEKGAS